MRTLQTLAIALATAGTLACSSGSSHPSSAGLPEDLLDHDASAAFAGVWYGTATLSLAGAQQTVQTELEVSVTGRNALTFPGFCGDGTGPDARVTSDSLYVLAAHACPIPVDASCSITWQIGSGGGTLANGVLTFTATGTTSGCGFPASTMSLTFSGSRGVPIDHGPPTAVATSPVETAPGTAVTLDASASSDPDGRALTFSWVMVQQPPGATSTLDGVTTATPTFTSSVAGTYLVRVTVTAADGQSATADVTLKVVPPSVALPALSHRVAQAAYSASLGRIVMTDGSPNALYVYDPATATEASVALSLPPQCLSVSPDGKYAVVGHNAWISYVDLAAAKVLKTIPVSADVGDCVLGGNGWAYLFPRVDQWVSLHNVELATGVEVNTGSWQIYAGDRAALSPSDPGALYVVTAGLSPAQIYRWDISGGAATYKWESPYWGDHPMGPDLWFSADGARLFTAAGTAFRTSSTQSQDLQYGGQLSGLSSVKQLDASTTEIAAIPAVSSWYPSTTTDDTTVELFDTTYLGHQDRITLPWWAVGSDAFPTHGLFVFHGADGARRYVIVQADGASGLLRDTAVLTY